jgi:F-type H+-transporting ATPase subunit epsilon
VTLHVELVMPDRRVWAGESSLVIAKTLEGDIGILTGHPPVLGVLATGSVVRILGPQAEGAAGQAAGGQRQGAAGAAAASGGSGDSGETAHAAAGGGTQSPAASVPGEEIAVAVGGGFLSVADDRVSILASEAELGSDVDTAAVRADLDAALASGGTQPDGDETPEVKYARARLRAAGEEA